MLNEGASNGNRVGPSPTAFQDFNKGQDGKHGSGGVSDLESTSPWVPPLRNEEAFAFPYEAEHTAWMPTTADAEATSNTRSGR